MRLSAMAAFCFGLIVASLGSACVTKAQSLVTQAAVVPDTPAGKRFSEWLTVFNRGDDEGLKTYLRNAFPGDKTAPDLFVDVRSDTGSLIPFDVKTDGPDKITAVLAQRDTDSFNGITLQVEAAEPHRITLLQPSRLPRPADAPPMPKLSEVQLLSALKAKLDRDSAAGIFSGVLLLAHNGRTIFHYASGFENRDLGTPMTMESRLGTASVGKMFTAVAVMQLVQAGKIDLSAPVGRYLPDYPNPAVATKVTVNELLTHTGGTGDIFGEDFDRHREELRTPADYIRLFGARDPVFEPGTRRGYSNFGFVILGRIVETVSGQTWSDYERDHVFLRSGMIHTGALPESVKVAHRALGYTLEGGKMVTTSGTSLGASPAGGAYTTAGDLLKFVDALLTDRLLDKAHTDLLLKEKVEVGGHDYPYDLTGKAENGAPFVGHQGGGRGENADVRAFPGNGYSLIILSNFGPPWQKLTQFVSNRLP